MADTGFFERTEKAEQVAKQHMRGRQDGPAIRYDDETPQGQDRGTMVISISKTDKMKLKIAAAERGKSVAALVREALRAYDLI